MARGTLLLLMAAVGAVSDQTRQGVNPPPNGRCEADAKGEAAKARAERPPVYRTDLADFVFPRRHPRLEHTAEEIDKIKRSMAGRDIREHAWVKEAQPWLDKAALLL